MATQIEISAHLGMSDRNLREVLPKIKMDHKVDSLDDIRLAYIAYLRDQASGHSDGNGNNIISTRVATAEIDKEMKLMALCEKRGELVHLSSGKHKIASAVSTMKNILGNASGEIRAEIKKQHGIEVDHDLINKPIIGAVGELSIFGKQLEQDSRGGII